MGAICVEPGSTTQYLTGSWRSQRPVSDLSKCNQCGFCYIFCPEGCIEQQADGFFKPDLDYCKGCGICAVECPRDVIKMVEE
ncbi:MAG: 4Fe-4S binding protein [Chloroflexota bacterium]